MVAYTRGDFSSKNGTAVITDSLTFVGTGGIDVTQAPIKSGSTVIVSTGGDINAAAVGGMRIMLPFSKAVADTLTASAALFVGSTSPYVTMPKAGSVIGVSVALNTAITSTGMHATFSVFKNATDTGLSVLIGQSVPAKQFGTATQVQDTDAFAAGDRINVKINSDTMTTVTAAIAVFVEM